MIKQAFFIIAVILITGCEFQAYKENFVEREPITPENLHIVFLSNFTDTILAFRNTECLFKLEDTPEASCHVSFKLQGKTWSFNTGNGSFLLNPDEFHPGLDTLKMNVFFNSGTIAENLGFGRLWLSHSWPVIVDHRPPPRLIPKKGVDTSGYMKIFWPKCDQENFEMYKLVITKGYETWTKYIYDKEASYFIDTLYVGGSATYSLTTYVFNYTAGETGTLSINEKSPAPICENHGYDSLRIFWNKGRYKCRYLISSEGSFGKIIYRTEDTSAVILNPGLGIRETYTLTTAPYRSSSYTLSQSVNYILGTAISSLSPSSGYNKIEKTLYSNLHDNLLSYDIYTLTRKKSMAITGLSSEGLFSAPSNSTRFATLTDKKIYVFADQNLTNPVIIPYDCLGKAVHHFFFSDNGYITVGRSPGFDVINVSTGKKVASAAINHYPYYNVYKAMATTYDGRYLCSVSHLGMDLFRFEADTLVKIHTDERAYNSVVAGLGNHLLYLRIKGTNTIEIRNAEDFSLVRAVELFPVILCGFDPENGLLLVADLKFLYVLDPDTFKIKLKVSSKEAYVNMFAGRLFTQTGYTLNISDGL